MSKQPRWVKSSLSLSNGNCAEVAVMHDGCVAIRDSEFPYGPIITFKPADWTAFISGAKAGEFDIAALLATP